MIHKTLPAEADFHESGWWDGGNGWEYTKLSLVDIKHALPDGTPLFARLSHADLKAFAAAHGCELWEAADFELVRAGGVVVEPCTINPDTQQLDGSVNHDTRCWAEIRKSGWDGSKPILGAGKYHRTGAPKGQAYLGGWYTEHLQNYGPRRGAGYVQRIDEPIEYSGSLGPHTDDIFDYGTLSVLKRRTVAATELPPDTQPSPAPDFASVLALANSIAGPILGAFEGAFDEFSHWFHLEGEPVAREADPHPAVHDNPRQLTDKKTPTPALDVFECLPEGDRRAKLILLAQWHLETAGGVSMHNYNIGNVKGKPNDPTRCWQFFQCGEELTLVQARAAVADPRVVIVRQYKRGDLDMASVRIAPEHPGCCFRAFEELLGGVLDYVALLKMPRYAQAYQRALAGDIAGFGILLGKGGYYTAPVDGYTAELGRRYALLDRTLPASQ